MPSLDELHERWFLDIDDPAGFPPQSRHPGALVNPYTDGNRVTPIYNGADYMARAYQLIRSMIDGEDPSACRLWLHAWRMEPVRVLGETADGPDIVSLLEEAARAGVQVRFLASGHDTGSSKLAKRIIAAGGQGARDRRTKTFGSHHQKFIVFRFPDDTWRAILGSGDFLYARWDTQDCNPIEPDRPSKGAPTHDVWLEIDGPAVYDVALHFAERWNDPDNRRLTKPRLMTELPVDFVEQAVAPAGSHSLQLLRTYPVLRRGGFSWSRRGEFTIWAAYLKAIHNASRYIYLEDQYFYSFEDPPLIGRPKDSLHAKDIVVQLGEAIRRGVDVLVTVPSRKGDWRKHYELQQRGKAMRYLSDCSKQPGSGRFYGCFLQKGDMDPIVHAKLMLTDDEYAIVGSANIGLRSMSYDSEVSFGLVDADGQLVRQLRTGIWAKHMEHAEPQKLDDIADAFDAFADSAKNESGRLRLLPPKLVGYPFPYRWIMNKVIDPYGGPQRISPDAENRK